MPKISAVVMLAAGLAASAAYAQVVRPVLSFPEELASSVTIDDAGSVVYAVSSTNQFGTNPGYRKQIVRWDPATGIGTPITDYEEGVESVSVSDDGSWVAFVTAADLLGTNHDESPELYVMHPDGTGLAQLTSENISPFETRGIRAAVLSGSGNRVAFVGAINPLGTNPANTMALFVIDRDGTNLRQLRTDVRFIPDQHRRPPYTYADFPSFDISDDGSKVVYTMRSPLQFVGHNANGTGQHTLSSTTNPGGIRISGDGTKVVYTTGFINNYSVRVRSFDGNPGTIVALGAGERASITDDASTVYYNRYASGPAVAGLWRVASTGGAQTLIAPDLRAVAMSGSGNRIVAFGTELVALDNTGGNLQQLTTTVFHYYSFVDELTMSSDGHTMHFDSSFDPLGTNPAHGAEYFSYNLDTGQLVQRTDASLPPTDYLRTDVAGDGSIVFALQSTLMGGSCAAREIYLKSPEGAVTQLTECPRINDAPEVRPDGQVVAFIAETTPSFEFELFAVNADHTAMTQLTPSGVQDNFIFYGFAVAGTGPTTWIAFSDNQDLYRVKADGSAFQQLTTAGGSDDQDPSISADGSVVAWSSTDDHGQNPNHAFETFVLDGTQTIRQITSEGGGGVPSVTQDGQWVFVGSSLKGQGRFHVASGTYEYVGGMRRALSPQYGDALPDATGSRWLLSELYDTNDTILLADLNVVPAFVVGKPSPTVLSWDPSPFSVRYDVVRGSISNLSISGSTVSLGPVSCLEDDSPDAHTRGHADPASPAPGQAFFYLYRGTVGFDLAAGSYGQGTGGRVRVAGAGGCAP